MAQRHVEEGRTGFGEDVVAIHDLPADAEAPAALALEPGTDEELGVDLNRLAVADEDPRGDRGKPVPRREEATGLVERCRHHAPVREPRSALMALVEPEPRLVLRRPLQFRPRQADPARGVSASPAGRVVVRRDYVRCHTFSNVPNRSSWSYRKRVSSTRRMYSSRRAAANAL